MRARLSMCVLSAFLPLLACSEGDGTPPAPALIEPVKSPTSLSTQVIRGTAEFGATIEITGAASVEPAVLTADPYTARWQATVGLVEGENALSVVVRDAAKNASQAASATIVREPIHAEALTVRLSRSLLSADDASLVVHITAGNDEPVDMTGLAFEVAVDGYPKTIAPVMATADAAGRADAIVTGLDAAGLGTIVVTAAASPGLEATGDFLVDAGRPATVDLLLSDGILPPAGAVTVAPATDVFAAITVMDQPENVIADAPITLFTDAPDAFIDGNRISDVTRAGTWRVVGLVSDSLLSDAATLTVAPGPGVTLTVSVAPALVRAGQPAAITAEVTDAFGNPVAATIALGSSDPAVAFIGGDVVHTAAGAKTITGAADLDGDGAVDLTGTASLEVAPDTVGPVTLALSATTTVAGTDLPFQLLDQFGNVIAGGYAITLDAPGAYALAGVLKGLTRSGTFTALATIVGSLNADDATLTVVAGPPVTVDLDPATTSAEAGVAQTFTVSVTDAFGNAIEPPSFTLSTTAPPGSTTFSAPAAYTFCAPGTFTVTADAGGPTATAAVSVTPGAPAALSLSTTPAPAVVSAGQTVGYTTTSLDSCGNVTSDAVQVTTNAPGAIVGATTISGLTEAGSFLIVARIPGTPLVSDAPLLVGADASTTAVSLFLTSHGTDVGLPIGYAVSAVDGFGNPVPGTPVISVPTDPAETIDTAAQTIRFSTTGTHTVTVTLGTASDSDFVVVTAFDATGPIVNILSPAGGTVVGPGATVPVVVSASDDVALTEIVLQATGATDFFQVQLAPGGTTSTTTTFNVPIPGGVFGPVQLIAQAVDTSGNRTNTPIRTVTVDPVANVVLVGGFAISTVTIGNLLANPRGIASFGSLVYVADSGTDQIIAVDRTTGAQTALTPTLTGAPMDLVYFDGATDFLYASVTGPNQLQRITTAGAASAWTGTAFGQQRGVTLQGTDLWTVSSDDQARRFIATDAPLATPACTIDLSGVGGFPGLGGNGRGVAAQAGGAMLFTDDGNNRVWRITTTQVANACSFGIPPAATQVAGGGDVSTPRDIVVAPSGLIYYVNRGDGRLMRIDLTAGTVTPIASGFAGPWGLAFDAAGALLVTDEVSDAVYVMTGPF